MQLSDIAEHDKCLAGRGADVFARPHVHLQHRARQPAPAPRTFDFGLRLRDWASACAIAARAMALSGSQAPAVSNLRSPSLVRAGERPLHIAAAGYCAPLRRSAARQQLLRSLILVEQPQGVRFGRLNAGPSGRNLVGPRHLFQLGELRLRRRKIRLLHAKLRKADGHRRGTAPRRPSPLCPRHPPAHRLPARYPAARSQSQYSRISLRRFLSPAIVSLNGVRAGGAGGDGLGSVCWAFNM